MQDLEFVLGVSHNSKRAIGLSHTDMIAPTVYTRRPASHVKGEHPDVVRRYPILRNVHVGMGEVYQGKSCSSESLCPTRVRLCV